MKTNIRFKCILSSMLLVIANMELMLINTYAGDLATPDNNIQNVSDNYVEFYEYKDDYEYVSQKVDQEVENKELSSEYSEVEEYLNQNGVFDDEIEDIYDEDKLDDLKNMDEITDAYVSVQYYAVDDLEQNEDGEEDEDVTLDQADMVQLTDEQVDMHIAEKYYGEETDLYKELEDELEEQKTDNEEGHESIVDDVLESIGLKPMEVYAETQTKQGKSILKKIVTCTKSRGDYVNTNVTVVWDTMPQNRKLDSIGVLFDNGQYERDATGDLKEITVKHFYTWTKTRKYVNETVGSKKYIQYMTKSSSEALQNNQYRTENNKIYFAMKLHSDDNYLGNDGYAYTEKITKEGLSCDLYVRLTTLNKQFLGAYIEYMHLKKGLNPIETIISLADNANITVIYRIINGQDIQYEYDLSGVDSEFEFYFK